MTKNIKKTGLQIQNLEIDLDSKKIRIRAAFFVEPGERLAIVGPSGSGKTTILKAISGFIRPDAGEILLNERDLKKIPIEKRNIGFVSQRPALFPSLNVVQNLSFALRMRGVPKKERLNQAMDWLQKLGLLSQAKAPIQNLSGGEAQRLCLGRALIFSPDLLLFDEPLSALDAPLKASMRELILDLHRENPIPLVLVTHDEADVAALATAVVHYKAEADFRTFVRHSH